VCVRCLFSVFVVIGLATSCGCGSVARSENAEGVRLYQQGNYLGAVNHFQQALARQPGNPDCFYNLGATYHQQGKLFARPADFATAEQYYHLCLARSMNHEACQRALAVLLVEQRRDAEALAGLQQWARCQPGNPQPFIEMARLAQEHGDLREAENQLIDALSIAPGDPRALVALGHLRELTGDSSQALANYARALSSDPLQPVVAARAASLNAGLQPSPVLQAGVAATPGNPGSMFPGTATGPGAPPPIASAGPGTVAR